MAAFYAAQSSARDRLQALQDELGTQDPLSLRKIEREEIMKNTLRWLLGPEFAFVPSNDMGQYFDAGGGSYRRTCGSP